MKIESTRHVAAYFKHFTHIDKINEIIILLETYSKSGIYLEELRKRLLQALDEGYSEILPGEKITLSDFIYQALLFFAKLHPLNSEDPISLNKIEEDDKVFVSTGYQFSLKNLMKYHYSRPVRQIDNSSKRIINPLTNAHFSIQDELHIMQVHLSHNYVVGGRQSVRAVYAQFVMATENRDNEARPQIASSNVQHVVNTSVCKSIYQGHILESAVLGMNLGGKIGLNIGTLSIYLILLSCLYVLPIVLMVVSLLLSLSMSTGLLGLSLFLAVSVASHLLLFGLFILTSELFGKCSDSIQYVIGLVAGFPFSAIQNTLQLAGMIVGGASATALGLTSKIIQAPYKVYTKGVSFFKLPVELPSFDLGFKRFMLES